MTPVALVQAVSMLAAATFHDKSKTAFYVLGGGLALWAVIIGVSGFTRADFPGSAMRGRAVMVISFVLMVAAMGSAVATASTPPPAQAVHEEHRPAEGHGAAPDPAGRERRAGGQRAGAAGARGNRRPGGERERPADVRHDKPQREGQGREGDDRLHQRVAPPPQRGRRPGRQGVGEHADLHGRVEEPRLKLKPGSYTYYCTVPGHRQAGMQGTLTVS